MNENETHAEMPTTDKKSGCGHWIFVFTVGLAAVFLALLFPALRGAQEDARRMQCSSHNKQISLALHNYHDKYKAFPPAYTVDAEGNRLHSWRVLILPFVEQQQLYDNIRLNEPWDSEHNRQFHSYRPHTFACPSAPDGDDYNTPYGKRNINTNYVRIVGENTTTMGSGSVSQDDFQCDRPKVLMVIETTRPICWMEPEDLTLEELAIPIPPRPGKADRIGPDSWHRKIINGSMADGGCIYLLREIPPEVICEAALIKGRKASDIRDYTE